MSSFNESPSDLREAIRCLCWDGVPYRLIELDDGYEILRFNEQGSDHTDEVYYRDKLICIIDVRNGYVNVQK